MGSALVSGGSIQELAGISCAGHGGSFQQLLTEVTPVAPHNKTWPYKPNSYGRILYLPAAKCPTLVDGVKLHLYLFLWVLLFFMFKDDFYC